jgi:phage FluMu gp28-like protein
MDSLKRPRLRRSARPPANTNELARGAAATAASPAAAAEAGARRAVPLPNALRLLPYQQRWVKDSSPLKIVVKARQIGYSFAATLRAVLECMNRKTTWIFLSKGERQSRLLMEKVAEHVRSFGATAEALESTYMEGTLTRQLETRFPNGSVIYGLPANPDTARGYTGNVTLDEFAFHSDAAKIYTALFPSITRGYGVEVISTPNGTQGKFYELAKAAGLTEGLAPSPPASLPRGEGGLQGRVRGWSAHRSDIYEAVRQGLRIDLQLLRAGCEDETAWQQEFCCEFVSTAENFFSPELLAASLSAEASSSTPLLLLASARGARPEIGDRDSGIGEYPSVSARGPNPQTRNPSPEFFLGVDIGRKHDRTVFWVDEVEETKIEARNAKLETGDANIEFRVSNIEPTRRSVARLVRTMADTPFSEQLAYARELLSLRKGSGEPLISRVAIDATGIGLPLAESLAQEFGPRVEPVVFTAAMKEDLAYRTRRRMEDRLTLLPDTREVRAAFSAVKKYVTPAGNVRFDAARTDAGHADEFWAKALADYAADQRPGSSLREVFLADAASMISPRAFALEGAGWPELEM